LFVDLVKAFDTIDRELMFQILSKFGIPESMIYVIRRLYDDNEIKISVGAKKGSVKNTVGVKQGDTMAAVLFILVMQAMAETLTPLWTQAEIKTPQYRFHRETESYRGRMKGQGLKAKGQRSIYFYHSTLMTDLSFSNLNKTWPRGPQSSSTTCEDSVC
jgi:hypothetical protein